MAYGIRIWCKQGKIQVDSEIPNSCAYLGRINLPSNGGWVTIPNSQELDPSWRYIFLPVFDRYYRHIVVSDAPNTHHFSIRKTAEGVSVSIALASLFDVFLQVPDEARLNDGYGVSIFSSLGRHPFELMAMAYHSSGNYLKVERVGHYGISSTEHANIPAHLKTFLPIPKGRISPAPMGEGKPQECWLFTSSKEAPTSNKYGLVVKNQAGEVTLDSASTHTIRLVDVADIYQQDFPVTKTYSNARNIKVFPALTGNWRRLPSGKYSFGDATITYPNKNSFSATNRIDRQSGFGENPDQPTRLLVFDVGLVP